MDELEFIPEEHRVRFEEAFEKQKEMEGLEFLEDLGYLPSDASIDNSTLSQKKLKAIAQFRNEYTQLIDDENLSNFPEIYRQSLALMHENDPASLSEREHFLFSNIIGLEDDLQIFEVPKQQISLLSRVVMYRFVIYDLMVPEVNSIYNEETIAKLSLNLARFEYDGAITDFANMLGDQEKLSEFVINNKKLNRLLYNSTIFFKVDKRSGKELLRTYKRQVSDKASFMSVIPDNANKPVIKKIIEEGDEPTIDTYIQMLENQFLIRVLQVKLWILGMYEGKLDTDFGDQTYLALRQLLDYLAERENGGAKEISKLIFAMRKKQWAFNIEYFLKSPMAELEGIAMAKDETSVSKVYDFVLEQHEAESQLATNQIDKVEEGRKEIKDELETELISYREEILAGRTKKRYKGRKGILRLASKLFELIKKPIRFLVKLIKKIFQIIKKSIKTIFDEIREAVQALGRGLKFLFGKRIVKSDDNGVVADFDFDFDGSTVILEGVLPDTIKTHISSLQSYSSSIYKALNFVKTVVQWGLQFASGPVGWIKIAIGIARLFKDIIVDRIERKEIVALVL